MRGTYYGGAYWGYGFHEDGVKSALRGASTSGWACDAVYEGGLATAASRRRRARFRHRVFMTLSRDGPVWDGSSCRPRWASCFNPARFHYEMDGGRGPLDRRRGNEHPRGERRTYRFEGRGGRATKDLHVSPFLAHGGRTTCCTQAPLATG